MSQGVAREQQATTRESTNYDESTGICLNLYDVRFEQTYDVNSVLNKLFRNLGLLGEGAVVHWTDLAQRAWSLLLETYESVRAAGRLVFRHQEDVDATYPSLIAAVRAPATRAKPTPPPAPPPGTTTG